MTDTRNILITGGSGFVGKNLTDYLTVNYHILSPSHAELDLLSQAAVEKYFQEHAIDVVVHAAAVGVSRTQKNSSQAFSQNLRMFFNLARCEQYFKKMIFLGSGAEYDKSHDLKLVAEDSFGQSVPADEYGFYKYICSQYIAQTSKIINLRVFALYGPGEEYQTRFISQAICKTLLGLPVTIFRNAKFDYLFIKDLVKIVDYFIEHIPAEKFYNVGTGHPVELTAIAELVQGMAQAKTGVTIENSGYAPEYSCNNRRLLGEMPELNFTPLEQGVEEMFAWYKTHPQEWSL